MFEQYKEWTVFSFLLSIPTTISTILLVTICTVVYLALLIYLIAQNSQETTKEAGQGARVTWLRGTSARRFHLREHVQLD